MGRQAVQTQYKHNNVSKRSVCINALLFLVYHKQQFTLKVMNVYDERKSSKKQQQRARNTSN